MQADGRRDVHDPDVFRGMAEIDLCLALPQDVFARPGFMDKLGALRRRHPGGATGPDPERASRSRPLHSWVIHRRGSNGGGCGFDAPSRAASSSRSSAVIAPACSGQGKPAPGQFRGQLELVVVASLPCPGSRGTRTGNRPLSRIASADPVPAWLTTMSAARSAADEFGGGQITRRADREIVDRGVPGLPQHGGHQPGGPVQRAVDGQQRGQQFEQAAQRVLGGGAHRHHHAEVGAEFARRPPSPGSRRTRSRRNASVCSPSADTGCRSGFPGSTAGSARSAKGHAPASRSRCNGIRPPGPRGRAGSPRAMAEPVDTALVSFLLFIRRRAAGTQRSTPPTLRTPT